MYVTITTENGGDRLERKYGLEKKELTSNDCAYQSCTFLTDGMSLRPSGRFSSSWTRCAKRMGSSSARNWEALKRVPIEGSKQKVRIELQKRIVELLSRKESAVSAASRKSADLPTMTMTYRRKASRQTAPSAAN